MKRVSRLFLLGIVMLCTACDQATSRPEPPTQVVYRFDDHRYHDEYVENVFTDFFGENDDKDIYLNACGTRVSLALLGVGGQVGNRGIKITNKSNKFYGKQIEPNAERLKTTLEGKWERFV